MRDAFTPLLPHQKPFGYFEVHMRDGCIEVPLSGNPKHDADLQRQASVGGRFALTVHGPEVAPRGPLDPEDDFDRSL